MAKKKKAASKKRKSTSRVKKRIRFYRRKRFLLPVFFLAFLCILFLGGEELPELRIPLPKDAAGVLEEAEDWALQAREWAEGISGKLFPDAELKQNQDFAKAGEGTLSVWFLDVGQGSSALAESEGHFILIDGGDRETSSKVVAFLKEQGVETLDYVVLSHYDSDHLAGAVGVLNQFSVEQILSPDYEADTKLYQSYCQAVKEKTIPEYHPEVGEAYSFGEASFTVVGPEYYGHGDENDDSLCIRLTGGGGSFLFCGDAGEDAEEELEEGDQKLQSDVYVVNHHGSAGSTSEDFFDRVSPTYAVLSCGADNSYGHPAKRVMELLKRNETELFRTDLQGTIKAVCRDGNITFDVPVCSDYSYRSTY